MPDLLNVRSRFARIAIALSAAIIVPAGFAAQAPAAGTPSIKVSNARFKVVVQGTQTTAWKHDHKKAFECDADTKGEATEVVRFKTAPTVVDVMRVDKYQPMFTVKNKFKSFLGQARVTRRGTYYTGPSKACSSGDGTGGETPPAPDCGTRNASFFFDLSYVSGKGDRLRLEQDREVLPLVGFKNCPIGGTSWPQILEYSTGSKNIGGRMPFSELFNKRHGQIGARAAGRDVYADAEDQHTTTIDWNVLMTRVKTARR